MLLYKTVSHTGGLGCRLWRVYQGGGGPVHHIRLPVQMFESVLVHVTLKIDSHVLSGSFGRRLYLTRAISGDMYRWDAPDYLFEMSGITFVNNVTLQNRIGCRLYSTSLRTTRGSSWRSFGGTCPTILRRCPTRSSAWRRPDTAGARAPPRPSFWAASLSSSRSAS
jgi:hypothetical protein